MATCEIFQKRFLELIEDLECKKSEIPKTIGFDYDVFTKIVEYGKIPKVIILTRIAEYFHISVEYLLGRTTDEYFEKSKTPQTFHFRYESLKKEAGLTDYSIAQKLHISTSYTTNWKKKNYLPSLDNLIILTEVFKVSLDYLLGRTDDRN